MRLGYLRNRVIALFAQQQPLLLPRCRARTVFGKRRRATCRDDTSSVSTASNVRCEISLSIDTTRHHSFTISARVVRATSRAVKTSDAREFVRVRENRARTPRLSRDRTFGDSRENSPLRRPIVRTCSRQLTERLRPTFELSLYLARLILLGSSDARIASPSTCLLARRRADC